MNKRLRYSKEVRQGAVLLVITSEYEHLSHRTAKQSVAAKISYTSETLRTWINKLEIDSGTKSGVPSDHTKQMKELERRIES